MEKVIYRILAQVNKSGEVVPHKNGVADCFGDEVSSSEPDSDGYYTAKDSNGNTELRRLISGDEGEIENEKKVDPATDNVEHCTAEIVSSENTRLSLQTPQNQYSDDYQIPTGCESNRYNLFHGNTIYFQGLNPPQSSQEEQHNMMTALANEDRCARQNKDANFRVLVTKIIYKYRARKEYLLGQDYYDQVLTLKLFRDTNMNSFSCDITGTIKDVRSLDFIFDHSSGYCNSLNMKTYRAMLGTAMRDPGIMRIHEFDAGGWIRIVDTPARINNVFYVTDSGVIGHPELPYHSNCGYSLDDRAPGKTAGYCLNESIRALDCFKGEKNFSIGAMIFIYSYMGIIAPILSDAGISPNEILALIGKTQTKKSTIAAELLQVFREKGNKEPKTDTQFTSTRSGIMDLVKEKPCSCFLLDDFTFMESSSLQQGQETKFEFLTRVYGDRVDVAKHDTFTGKVNKQGAVGMLAVTGEYFNGINSTRSRYIIQPFDYNTVDTTTLNKFQNSECRNMYCSSFYHFIRFVSDNYEQILDDLGNHISAYKAGPKLFRADRYNRFYIACNSVVYLLSRYACAIGAFPDDGVEKIDNGYPRTINTAHDFEEIFTRAIQYNIAFNDADVTSRTPGESFAEWLRAFVTDNIANIPIKQKGVESCNSDYYRIGDFLLVRTTAFAKLAGGEMTMLDKTTLVDEGILEKNREEGHPYTFKLYGAGEGRFFKFNINNIFGGVQ